MKRLYTVNGFIIRGDGAYAMHSYLLPIPMILDP